MNEQAKDQTRGAPAHPLANPWPSEVRLAKTRDTLHVTFDNGESYALSAEYLRVNSPSAEVRGHGAGPAKLVVGKENVKIEALEPVGNYAIRIIFDDGHSTGLYSWDYLFDLGSQKTRIWGEYQSTIQESRSIG